MKKLKSKSLMVLTILVASTIAMPAMASGYQTDDSVELNQFGGLNPGDLIRNFGGFGNIFSNYLGPSGALLGQIFLLLFNQTLEIEEQKVGKGLYVLNATITKNPQALRNQEISGGNIYYLPLNYSDREQGYYYCKTNRSGEVNIDVEIGGSITLIIWDQDESFINALKRLIRAIKTFMTASEENMESVIRETVSTITWFLIHINDIFNGDELFVLNPMTYQKLTLEVSSSSLTIEKNWRYTGPDGVRDGNDTLVSSTKLDQWRSNATINEDAYMSWLLYDETYPNGAKKTWTQFSFDIFQFWMKNFEININVADLLSDNPDFAKAFSGCDIEFYLFTHSLAGSYLYKDIDGNRRVTANYTTYGNGTDAIELPRLNEITHLLHLKNGTYNFREPEIVGGNVEWGLNISKANISPVPIGADSESYFNDTHDAELDYIYFGLKFIPSVSGSLAKGRIKLDHFFTEWDNKLSTDYGLSTIYISTVLHFHLDITNVEEDPGEPLALLQEDDYKEKDESIKIGNYLGTGGELEFVDIASENYTYGANQGDNEDDALSSKIPIALYEMEVNAHKSYDGGTSEDYQPYSANASLTLDYSVLGYAVSYPNFEDGNGIWHDPTFNVFMVLEPTAFWAVILLIGGISILGVATILIKRKKDGKAPF